MGNGRTDTGGPIAITGGSGFVGRHLVRHLLARGRAVRVLTRDPARAATVLPKSGEVGVIAGDPFDAAAMGALLDGAGGCVHLIGIIREASSGQTFRRVHVDATRAVVEACAAAGVRRYVHMSAIAADPLGRAAYQRTKFEGERVVEASGLDWTIIRPGLIHGPDGEFTQMAKGWAEGRRFPFVVMPYFFRVEQEGTPSPVNPPRLVDPVVAPVHVEDVARLFADALESPEAVGEIYRVSGPERVSFPEMLRFFRDNAPHGKRGMPAVGIPGVLAAAKAIGAKALGLGGLLPFDAGMALMGEQDAVCDNGKAHTHLGFEPRGFRESAREYLAG